MPTQPPLPPLPTQPPREARFRVVVWSDEREQWLPADCTDLAWFAEKIAQAIYEAEWGSDRINGTGARDAECLLSREAANIADLSGALRRARRQVEAHVRNT